MKSLRIIVERSFTCDLLAEPPLESMPSSSSRALRARINIPSAILVPSRPAKETTLDTITLCLFSIHQEMNFKACFVDSRVDSCARDVIAPMLLSTASKIIRSSPRRIKLLILISE